MLVLHRRDLHMHPELGYEEHRTSDLVASRLEEWGLEVTRDIAGPPPTLRWHPWTGAGQLRRLLLRARLRGRGGIGGVTGRSCRVNPGTTTTVITIAQPFSPGRHSDRRGGRSAEW